MIFLFATAPWVVDRSVEPNTNVTSFQHRSADRQEIPISYPASSPTAHVHPGRDNRHLDRNDRPHRFTSPLIIVLVDILYSKIILVKIICVESKSCYTSAVPDATENRVGGEGFVPRPLTEHMGWLMSRASHSLGVALAECLAPLGLNLRDYTVLIAAERAAIEGTARTQLALAQAARLDKSTMVVALDALEEEGLVERRPDPKDRRARIVVPTDTGRELLVRAEEVVVDVEGTVLAELGAEELRVLRGLLTHLVVGRRSVGDGPSSCC